MRLVTSGEAKELDLQAQQLGVSGLALMEAAACKAALIAKEMLRDCRHRRVLVLAGRGNNGGDGLAMARHLRNAGIEVRVYLCGHATGLPSEAAANFSAWTSSGGHCAVSGNHPSFWDEMRHDLAYWAELVVDALLGIGQTRPAQGDIRLAVEALGAQAATGISPRVLALDVPTGVDADTGAVYDLHVSADVTVTFGLPKVGLFCMRGAEAAGEVYVADIGLPGVDRCAPTLGGQIGLFGASQARPVLPPRRQTAHKGDSGIVVLIGGSPGMTGAAVLMAQAAVLGGAGLVTLAVPEAVQPVVACGLREAMTFPLPASASGGLALEAALRLAASCDAVALGPGMGRTPVTAQMIRAFVNACPAPLVLDADGLNAFEGQADLLAARASAAPLIITPHPGELARLLGVTVSDIQGDRMAAARSGAARTGATCLLKGAGTVVAASDGTVHLISAGNPAMASGGMGDVLTGLLAALLAQSMVLSERSSSQPAVIAAAAALLHAVAGDLAAHELGGIGLRAGDVAERFPRARRAIAERAGPPAHGGPLPERPAAGPLAPSLLGVKGIV